MTGNENINNVAQIQWSIGATLLNSDGSKSLGYAGSINGVNENVLIIAGGANFHDKMPWEGGQKCYSDQIHVLEKIGEEYRWNTQANSVLPQAIAYCGSVSTDFGIVYVGGENEDGLSDKVFILSWNTVIKQVEVKELPSLPFALISPGLSQIENVVYLLGGDGVTGSSSGFFKLDLNEKNLSWKRLVDVPLALSNVVTVVQNSAKGRSVFAIGGRTKTKSGISVFHQTVFTFNFQDNKWTERARISDGENTINLSAGTGWTVGENYIILAGGDLGIIFNQVETYLNKLAKPISDEDRLALTIAKNKLNVNHEGFYKGILIYDTFKNRWNKIGELPYIAQVTTTAILWDDDIILPSGEVKPGVRTPNIIVGKIMN